MYPDTAALHGNSSLLTRTPKGALVRSTSGTVQSDEWLLTVCRVQDSDVCYGSVSKGSTVVGLTPTSTQKGSGVYYLFAKGSSLPTGSSELSVSSRDFAVKVADLSH